MSFSVVKKIHNRLDDVRETLSEKKKEFRKKYRVMSGLYIHHFPVTKEEMGLSTLDVVKPNKSREQAIELLGSFQTKEDLLSLLNEIEANVQFTYTQIQKTLKDTIRKLNLKYSEEEMKLAIFYRGPQKIYVKVGVDYNDIHFFLFEPEHVSVRAEELLLRALCIEEIKSGFSKLSILKHCKYDCFEIENHWLRINDQKIIIEIEKKGNKFQLRCLEYDTQKCVRLTEGDKDDVIMSMRKQAEIWAKQDRLKHIL